MSEDWRASTRLGKVLPPGWCEVALGELLPLEYGRGLTAKNRRPDGIVPVFGSSGIVGYHDSALTEGPTIIVGRKGTAGAVYLSKGPCWAIDTSYFARPSKELEPRYLAYLLQHLRLGHLDQSTTLPSLGRDEYNRVIATLAPSGEQARIAEKMDQLFSDIETGAENLQRVRALLAKHRQAVLKAAVTGELTRAWREKHGGRGETGAELLRRILKARRVAWEAVELKKLKAHGIKPKGDRWEGRYREPDRPSSLGPQPLPQGWAWASLDQVSVSVNNGLSRKPNKEPPGIPILRISAVRPMSVDAADRRYYPVTRSAEVENFFLSNGDLLFTRYNGSFHLVGVCGCYTGQEKVLHPDKLIRARLVGEECVNSRFVAACMNAGQSRSFIEEHIKTTAGQHGIAGVDIKHTPFPLPPLREQQEISHRLSEAFSAIDALQSGVNLEVARAARLRQSILGAAFSGRLVPQDPKDEPASVLLERIRKARAKAPPPRGRRRNAGQLELMP